jgi:hypothetical protein
LRAQQPSPEPTVRPRRTAPVAMRRRLVSRARTIRRALDTRQIVQRSKACV